MSNIFFSSSSFSCLFLVFATISDDYNPKKKKKENKTNCFVSTLFKQIYNIEEKKRSLKLFSLLVMTLCSTQQLHILIIFLLLNAYLVINRNQLSLLSFGLISAIILFSSSLLLFLRQLTVLLFYKQIFILNILINYSKIVHKH